MGSDVADQTAAPVQAGEILAGKYQVERILGAGGMGVVVAARHLVLDQMVALKFALPAALTEPSQVERFEREARAAAKLKSEHVAKVIDFGKLESGVPYMVMEYLDGIDLGALLETQGPLSLQTAADYILQACEALAEAHSAGIVHRDIKPQNLFLARGVGGAPIVKVLDFGISKLLTSGDAMNSSALTRTATIMGSPRYMAPEQLRSSRNLDVRIDIWALGVVLYELLSGAPPFDAETMTELTLRIVQDSPRRLLELRPDLPPSLIGIVDKCLAKKPEDRFQDAGALATALALYAPASSSVVAVRALQLSKSGDFSGRQSLIVGPTPSNGVGQTMRLGAGSANSSGNIAASPSGSGSVSATPPLTSTTKSDTAKSSNTMKIVGVVALATATLGIGAMAARLGPHSPEPAAAPPHASEASVTTHPEAAPPPAQPAHATAEPASSAVVHLEEVPLKVPAPVTGDISSIPSAKTLGAARHPLPLPTSGDAQQNKQTQPAQPHPAKGASSGKDDDIPALR